MFQYAAARAQALRLGSELVLDTRFYPISAQNRPMRFCLDRVPIKARIIRYPAGILSAHALPRRFIRAFITERANVRYHEPELGFHPAMLNVKDGVVISGNFQSEKYFSDHADTIRQELRLDGIRAVQGHPMEPEGLVSVHVRRGDYVSLDGFLMNDPADYYATAMAYISERVPNARFLVFSDDIAWCRNQEVFHNCIFSWPKPNQDHMADLYHMSHCAHYIIANSSFSWWAAWLNGNREKIVIAPKYWFKNQRTRDLEIVPNSWVVI